jgi:hypothetical protein
MQDLLTLDETATQLRKTPAALRWAIHAGKGPKSGLVGGRRMFRQSDIDAYIEAAFDQAA